jgi:surface carbohydrate biosynthesis protein
LIRFPDFSNRARPLEEKPIDVLWLIEHVAREFDVACAVKAIAEHKYNLKVEVCNLYQHIQNFLVGFDPKVVVHPFVYFVKGALATEEVFKRWPDAIHVNVAWEQLHYNAHKKIKAPADEITKTGVIHYAWGNFYRDYLLEHGVPESKVVVNGHPAYQLYKDPYRSFFQDRAALAQAHNLDLNKRWIFVPENYRWAFAQKKIDFFVSLGGDRKELEELVKFSIPSLKLLLMACLRASNEDNIEIIFRPRPAVPTRNIQEFFKSEVGKETEKIKFIKEGSVREWILASDLVVSSYSTSLLEAAIAGKPAWMFAPIQIPDSLHCEWYDYAPKLGSPEEFVDICVGLINHGGDSTLAHWALKTLLPASDPIERLAADLKNLSQKTLNGRRVGELSSTLMNKEYFNKESHEMDSFSERDVHQKSQLWKKHLFKEKSMSRNWNESPINKSMDRDDLMSSDATPLIQELNTLIREMYRRGVSPSSWVGTLPKTPIREAGTDLWGRLQKVLFKAKSHKYQIDKAEAKALERGDVQRLQYQPLEGSEDDLRYPWFLYWEIYWVLQYMRPQLRAGMRLLDAGGASSLFSCYMASQGYELHSVDLNERLLANGEAVAKAMGWKGMHSYCMDMRNLDLPSEHFDHAFSICVFEHLDFDIKQAALKEIARCLKPGGILSLTFDYRNPAPGVVGIGKDPSPRNALKTEADIQRSFLGIDSFELIGNQKFQDNQKSYLQHPTFENAPYTFGSVFLRKKR